MPKFPVAYISGDFLRKNKFMMGKLSPQERLFWFVPFLKLNGKGEYQHGETIKISLDLIREFTGTVQDDTRLTYSLKEAYTKIDRAYGVKKSEVPFNYKGVEKGYAYFQIQNTFVFSSFYHRQYYQIDLNEIASYEYKHKKNKKTIPLLLYCLSHRHVVTDKETGKKYWVVDFGDKQLKAVLGLSKYDYVYVPDGKKAFYEEYDIAWCETGETNHPEWIDRMLKKYNFSNEEEMRQVYKSINPRFKRFDFEQKVLLPAINEINAGHIIHFVPQEVYKRSKNGEAATLQKSYIGKNYTKLEKDKCVIVNDQIIDSNITDYHKLQKGKQYTFLLVDENLQSQNT